MKNLLRVAAVSAAAMFLAAGCLSANFETTVNPDGSGSSFQEARVSRAVFALMFEMLGQELGIPLEFDTCKDLWEPDFFDFDGFLLDEALLAEIGTGAVEGPSFNTVGVELADPPSLTDMGIEVVEEFTEDETDCLARRWINWTPGEAHLVFDYLEEYEDMAIGRFGDAGWRYRESFGELGEEAAFPGLDPEIFEAAIEDIVDISFASSITLPGRAGDHNADRLTSTCGATTFYWDINILNQPDFLAAETDGSEGCEGWGVGQIVTVVLVGLLAAAVVTGVLFYSSRYSGREEDSESEPIYPMPGGPAPGLSDPAPSDPEPSSSP